MGQNFRNYTNYTVKDIKYYEKTHTSKASNSGRLYKNFVRWLFKVREIKKEFKFNYKDIEKFEEQSQSMAILSGNPSNAFQRYLFNRNQKKITSFF